MYIYMPLYKYIYIYILYVIYGSINIHYTYGRSVREGFAIKFSLFKFLPALMF